MMQMVQLLQQILITLLVCTDGVSTYFEHETGLNQVKEGATTAITASIESGDFDIGQQGLAGDGEFMMKIRRVYQTFYHKQEMQE